MAPLMLFALVFVFLVLVLPAPAPAQTGGEDAPSQGDTLDTGGGESLLFQEIPSVFGASKYEQKVTEAPASVTIITAEEIRRYGHRTLADILRSARGFYTSNDRNFSYAGVRGFSRPGDFNTRLLILVDGFRTNDAVYNAGPIDREFPVDVDLIDRVEIARGPSASLYGTSAFFGVVNIITKSGRQIGGAQLAGALGSYDMGAGRVTYGDRFANGVDVIVSGTLSDTGGQDLFFPQFSDVNGGIATGVDYEQGRNFFGKVTFHDFTINGDFTERTKGIPTGSYETVFNDPGNFTLDGGHRLGVTYAHRFRGGLELTSRAGYDDIYEDGEYVYDWAEEGDPADLVPYIDRIQTKRVTSEITITKQLGDRHRVVAGSEYRNNFKMHQKGFDLDVYQDDTRDSTVWGLYAQDEFSLTENLILNAGVRFDRYGFDTTSSNVSPRVALIYNPFQDTTLKVLYGEAFRAPSAYELYFEDGGTTAKAAGMLDPELMRSTEVVVEQRLSRAWQVTGSVFHYAIDDLITAVLDPVDELVVFQNVDSIEAIGAEVEAEGKTATGWTGRLGYSTQNSHEQPVDLGALTNSTRHMAKASVIAPLIGERVFAGVEGLYVSSRRTLMDSQADGFFLTNLTLSTSSLLSGWDVSVSAYNLLTNVTETRARRSICRMSFSATGATFG